MYRRNNINNGILYSQNGMPQKDLTSDGDGSFAIGRKNYVETSNAINSTTQSQIIFKKWFIMKGRDYIIYMLMSYIKVVIILGFVNMI